MENQLAFKEIDDESTSIKIIDESTINSTNNIEIKCKIDEINTNNTNI